MEVNSQRIKIIDEADIETILANDIEFSGNLSFSNSVAIKGKFNGNIKSKGNLFVYENAKVDAGIEAGFVSIRGIVNGPIYATSRVEIFSEAVVNGDIIAPEIVMESGCKFNGNCTMRLPSEVLNEKKESN